MNAGIHIEVTSRPDSVAYAALLDTCEDPHIYATLDFHRFLTAAAGGEIRYLLAWRGGRLSGAAVYFTRTLDSGLRLVNSLPWYGTHGGCIGLAAHDSELRTALARALAAALQAPDVIAGTVVLTPSESAQIDEYLAAFSSAPLIESRVGQITALPSAQSATIDDALFTVVRQKTRNLVRKSLRQGFEESIDDSPDAWRLLHEIHAENMAAIGGKAKPWEHFEAIRAWLPPATRRLSLAVLDGQPVAALLLLAFGSTVEYITPVIRAAHRERQPLSFLIWRGMQWAVAGGYRHWNWGGTWINQHSLHHFKAGWGAEDVPYQYLVYASDAHRAQLRGALGAISQQAPYYYVYPHDRLPRDDPA